MIFFAMLLNVFLEVKVTIVIFTGPRPRPHNSLPDTDSLVARSRCSADPRAGEQLERYAGDHSGGQRT